MSFAKSVVENLINKYANVELVLRNQDGFDVFVLDNGLIIRLTAGNKRIPAAYVEVLAEVKLCMGSWEYDYWLGTLSN